jgi:hypothetical protein
LKFLKKLSEEQIKEIAEMLDTGYHICCINPDTGEVEIVFNNEMMSYLDDEEDDDIKAQQARIDSWQRFIRIEKPESHESFQIMENFVNEIIPDGKLKEQFWNALSRSHPFRNFNAIVHNCDYREDWFKFKQAALEEYVKREAGFE